MTADWFNRGLVTVMQNKMARERGRHAHFSDARGVARTFYISRKISDALVEFRCVLSPHDLACIALYLRQRIKTDSTLSKLVDDAMTRAA